MMNRRIRLIALLALLTAALLTASTALADVWYCPICGLQNAYNFCPRDGTVRPVFDDAPAVTNPPVAQTPQPALPVMGLATMKVSTRTGPGTGYTEPGTFRTENQYLPIYSISYDVNSVPWVQCEVTYAGLPMRVYTGLKRFDTATFDLSAIPTEYALGDGYVSTGYELRYGPGGNYASLKISVSSGRSVLVVGAENGWYQIEFQYGDKKVRGWIPVENVVLL